MWSFIRVVFNQCDLSSGWSFIYVISHQCDLSSAWSVISVVSHQCDLHQGGLLSGWSLNMVVPQQVGPSSRAPLYSHPE